MRTTIEEIREQGLTQEQVLEREYIGPEHQVHNVTWPDRFDDDPSAQPGDTAWLDYTEDGEKMLCFEDGDYTAQILGKGNGRWDVHLEVPFDFYSLFHTEFSFKARHGPMIGDQQVGFVNSVVEATTEGQKDLIILGFLESESMPLTDVEIYIGRLREEVDERLEEAEAVAEKLEVARENE